jgi:putative peptidoglycan lipid II flippase
VLGVVLWLTAGPDEAWVHAGFVAKLSRLALVVGAGAVAYFAALWLLGFRVADFNRREPP